jgi:hypothetical protein
MAFACRVAFMFVIGFIFMLMHAHLNFPPVFKCCILVFSRTRSSHRSSLVTAIRARFSIEISNFFNSSNRLLISSSKACFSCNFSSSSPFSRRRLLSISNCMSIFLHLSSRRHNTFFMGSREGLEQLKRRKERGRKCFFKSLQTLTSPFEE